MKKLLTFLLLAVFSLSGYAQSNQYGDVNGDYEVNIADVNAVIEVILSDVNNPSADVNGDGEINITDINVLIDIILNPVQLPENVHIYGDVPSSEGNVMLVTDETVVITCPPGEEPEVGDIIVSGITDNAPYGFLRRVEAVQTSRGQCVMTTTNASLEEVLPDGDYHIDIPLILPGQESTFNNAADAPSRVKFSTEFKGTIKFRLDGNLLDDVKFDIWPFNMTPDQEKEKENEVLNGEEDSTYPLQLIAKLTPSLDLTFDCKVRGRKLERLEIGGGMDLTCELLAKATLEKELDLTGLNGLELPGSIDMAPVTVMAGPVPVVFTPKIHFYLGVDLKGEVYVQLKLMSASASGSLSYVYTREPDPVTGEKHNFYHNFETSTLGDGDMEKRFQQWLVPKVGVSGSIKGILSPVPDVSVYNANDIFCVSTPLSPWVKLGGNLSITLNPNNMAELDYQDVVTLTGGADIGIAARFKLFGKNEVWEKDFTLLETELMEPLALTPRFDEIRVTPQEDPIPSTTPAIGFGTYMTKPNIQVLPDQDYGFAYGPKDEPNRTANWTFVSLKEQYDPEFEGDVYKHEYIQTAIDPATVQPGVPYRVSPYVQLFGHIVYKKGEDFMLDGNTPSVTVPVAEVDFGDVLVGSSHTQLIEIVNNSSLPQTVKVEVTSPFSISYNESCMSSLTIDLPANSCSPVTIMFMSASNGDYLGTATFTSEAIEGGSIVVPLHANALTEHVSQHEWVDLGLPSGTLWATCNVGASAPEEYGDYFAWGETAPKEVYNWETYKWCNGSSKTLTKYCTNSDYGYNGFVDNKTELEPVDDAAYVNWGSSWRMPTLGQQQELVDKCTWTWMTQNGVNGLLVTGPNGNTMFLPAAGSRVYDSFGNAGSWGYYWSRTLYSSNPSSAYYIYFNSDLWSAWSHCGRIFGLSVRAVYVSQEPKEFKLSETEVNLEVGESKTIFIFNGNGSYSVESGGSGELTVEFDGEQLILTGVEAGNVDVIVTDHVTNASATLAVTVTKPHEYVDLGLPSGTIWATCNVGASAPEEYGDYFAWGETEPKDYYNTSTYKWCNGSYNTLTKYCTDSYYGYNGFVDNKTELDPEDDAAYVNWGLSWRMPSSEQLEELCEQCTWTRTTQNGVNGRLVTGPNGNTMFLPAAGYRWGSSLTYAGTWGRYWSRTLYSSSPGYAYNLDCESGGWYSCYRCYRDDGFTVRAVRVSQN